MRYSPLGAAHRVPGSFTAAPRLYRYKPLTNVWTRRADPLHDAAGQSRIVVVGGSNEDDGIVSAREM